MPVVTGASCRGAFLYVAVGCVSMFPSGYQFTLREVFHTPKMFHGVGDSCVSPCEMTPENRTVVYLKIY